MRNHGSLVGAVTRVIFLLANIVATVTIAASEPTGSAVRITEIRQDWGDLFWLTHDRLIFWSYDSPGGVVSRSKLTLDTIFDCKSKRASRNLYQTWRRNVRYDVSYIDPTGEWCLDYDDQYWYVVEIAGHRRFRGPKFTRDGYQGVAWFPDAKRWAILQGTDKPTRVDIFEIFGTAPTRSIPLDRFGDGSWSFDITPAGNALIWRFFGENYYGEFAEVDLSSPRRPYKLSTIQDLGFVFQDAFGLEWAKHLHVSQDSEAVMSYSKDQIAWAIVSVEQPRGKVLGVPMPSKRARAKTKYKWVSIYTSDINGNNLHNVGIIPWERAFTRSPVIALSWRPGDSELSFEYRRALYSVPVAQR